jgi:hypothetical protein
VPPWRQVGQLEDRGIFRHDLSKRYDARVVLLRVLQAEELPSVVLFVVRHVQNRSAREHDRPQRNGRGVLWLIEGPVWFRQGA